MASTRNGYLAVKRQTISTPEVAVVPTHFLRYKEGDLMLKQDVIINDPVQNNRWLALHPKSGKISAEGSFKTDLDVNESVHFIAAALGGLSSADISSATDLSVYRHTMTIANALPVLTVEQGKGNLTDTTNNRQNLEVSRAFGTMVDSFTMKGGDNLIEFEAKLIATGIFKHANMITDSAAGSSVAIKLDSVEGLVTGETINIFDGTPQNEAKAIASMSTSAKTVTIATLSNSYTVAAFGRVELTPLTPSFSLAQREFTFDNCNFQFGADLTAAASAAEENIENWELTYNNQIEARYGSVRKSAGVIAPKGASCKFKCTKYFQSRADADKYLNVQQQAMILTITDNVIISATDTANTAYKLVIKLPDIRMTSHEMPTGKDDLYAYNIEAEAFYDTSAAYAITILAENAQAGTVYTA